MRPLSVIPRDQVAQLAYAVNDAALRHAGLTAICAHEAAFPWMATGRVGCETRTLVLARFVDGLFEAGAQVSAASALESLRDVSARTSRAFLMDLEEIRELAERRNILFIVANQQANSKSWFGIPEAQRQSMKGVTYRDEVSTIERILQRGEPISGYEFNFLIHARLMRDLEHWAHDKQLPFVDIVGLLDQERHHLVSWVHLDAYANGMVADALADEIVRGRCADQARRD